MSTSENTPDEPFRSGFVALLGAPNVGKSTLLNRMLGQKISITSRKPQTTRNRILGILHRPNTQLVFLDTPGIHRAKKPLNIRIVDVALSTLAEVDLILFLVDVSSPEPEAEQMLLQRLKDESIPVILVLNKTDLIPNPKQLKLIEKWSQAHAFEAIVPISAKHGTQVKDLITAMEAILPPGPPFFPEESVTDLTQRFLTAEIIREKAFRLTGEELPYAVAVTIDTYKETTKLVKVHATIHVERNSQKGIIIGKQGAKLKQIGASARKDIEAMVGCKVFLKLFVRVQKNWSKDTKALHRFGY
jgi:GTP-binding protein Era